MNNEKRYISIQPDAGSTHDGKEADADELGRLRGKEFVPADPKQAVYYYGAKQTDAVNVNPELSFGESMELFMYYNGKLRDLYEEHPELAPRRQAEAKNKTNINLGEKFKEKFEERLREVMRSQHYELAPGMDIATTKSFESQFMGYSFRLMITSVERDREGNQRRFTFELEDTGNKRFLNGAINIEEDSIAITLVPSIDPQRLDLWNVARQYKPEASDKVKAMAGLSYLLRIPEREYEPATGEQRAGSLEASGPSKSYDVGPERSHSTIPFRRRTAEKAEDVWDLARELLASFSEEEQAKIKDSKGGLNMLVYGADIAEDGPQENWSGEFNGYINASRLTGSTIIERANLESLAESALEDFGSVVICIEGTHIPPALDGRPTGKMQRPHLRRTESGVILATRSPENIRIKEIFKKKRRGGEISEEEAVLLGNFFRDNNITNPFPKSINLIDLDEFRQKSAKSTKYEIGIKKAKITAI